MKCAERGCRTLEWKCKDCGRVVNTATFGDSWIKLSDSYPPAGRTVFGVDMNDDSPCVDELMYMGEEDGYHDWSSYRSNTYTPTHWMPFPDLPEVKD